MFNNCNNPVRLVPLLSPDKETVTEKSGHLSKDTKLVRSRAWIQIQDKWRTQINGKEQNDNIQALSLFKILKF